MMFVYAYELVAMSFLMLLSISYSIKNWMKLRKNIIFCGLIHTSILLTILDMGLHVMRSFPEIKSLFVNYSFMILSGCCLLLMAVLFFVYFLACTGQMNYVYDRAFFITIFPAVLFVIMMLTTPWTHKLFTCDVYGGYTKGPWYDWTVVVIVGYIVATLFIIWKNPEKLNRKFLFFSILANIFYFAMMILQHIFLKEQYLLTYYGGDFLVLACYFQFQNLDRYIDRNSGGVSRQGMRKFVDERYLYQESFSCLGVEIQNYMNLNNICKEEELQQIILSIGKLLQKEGGRHNLFHPHNAQMVIIKKNQEEVEKLYQKIKDILPQTIRMNYKDIPVNYCFFSINTLDCANTKSDFYQVLSSMRRIARERDERTLLKFEGEVKDTISQELQIGKVINKIRTGFEYDICFTPVRKVENKEIVGLEVSPVVLDSKGEQIEEKDFWQLAKSAGCLREIGCFAMENGLKNFRRENLDDFSVELGINVSTFQISSNEVVDAYIMLCKKYKVDTARVCLEITEDISMGMDEAKRFIDRLKRAGFHILLDQYGNNVYNLQSTLNMPYDYVKLSNSLVDAYFENNNTILMYQMEMLQNQKWLVGMDGVNNEHQVEKIRKLGAIFYQSDEREQRISPTRIRTILQKEKK